MPRRLVRTHLEYRPLESVDSFFTDGRPTVPCQNKRRLYFARDFDLILIITLILAVLSIGVHVFYNLFYSPPKVPNLTWVRTKCAVLEGVVNKQQDVIRFWSIPYAAAPIPANKSNFPKIAKDVQDVLGLKDGGYRWYKTIGIDNDEYCFLSFDRNRCRFADGRWRCKMTQPREDVVCTEFNQARMNVANSTENCLTLDITTPVYEGHLWPVVVVLSGYRSMLTPTDPASPTHSAYSPQDFVIRSTQAVWVNIRYRLGPYGSFYDFNQLDEDRIDYVNFALHDQLAALKWVEQSIEQFGGDPKRITLLGQGSGATTGLAIIGLAGLGYTSLPFQSAWLASGSVNWYNVKDDDESMAEETESSKKNKTLLKRRFRPADVMSLIEPRLVNKSISAHLYPANGEKNSPDMKKIRLRLTNLDGKVISRAIRNLYSEKFLLDVITNPKDYTNGYWYSIDPALGLGSPNRWDDELIREALKRTETSGLKALILSSMESEFEGIFDTETINVNLVKHQLEAAGLARAGRDFVRSFMESERSRLKKEVGSKDLDEVDLLLNALSAARVTCPQAWLINRWLTILKPASVKIPPPSEEQQKSTPPPKQEKEAEQNPYDTGYDDQYKYNDGAGGYNDDLGGDEYGSGGDEDAGDAGDGGGGDGDGGDEDEGEEEEEGDDSSDNIGPVLNQDVRPPKQDDEIDGDQQALPTPTDLYHIVINHPLSSVHHNTPGPKPSKPRRFPFHGLDLLMLTGNAPGMSSSYTKEFLTLFRKFVHNATFSDNCKLDVGQADGFVSGCGFGSNYIEPFGETDAITKFCRSIDWPNQFEDWALLD